MRPRALVLGIVVFVIGVSAPPAWATFPGRDGRLVVATAKGLELVAPGSGAATPVCPSAVLCGRPAQPRFSPNGRAIAFVDGSSRRAVVIAADGSCLWCLLGARLTTVTGARPAFTADAQGLTLARNGLWSVPLTGGRARRLVTGRVDDAAWSSRGLLAVERGGWIWIGRPGHVKLRRLARGHSPSFSPDGAWLALAREGYVWLVRVSDGRARRLARGSGPAWSPSGSRVAFIAQSGAVEVVAVGGGHPSHVGSVRGTALDWQPLVRPARQPCPLPSGATVVASSRQSIVFSRRAASSAQPNFYGCLRALGDARLLLDTSDSYFYQMVTVRLAGRFAALEPWIYSPEHVSFGASVYDLSTGRETPLGGIGWDWNVEPIVGTLDSLTLDSNGFAAWRDTTGPRGVRITALSCPSASLCVAGDDGGDILSSSDPTGGPRAWSNVAVLSEPIAAVTCPSISLCVGIGAGGDVVSSTNPNGGASTWATTTLDLGTSLRAMSCPSVSLCVAGGSGTTAQPGPMIVTATDPSGGPGAWSGERIAAGDEVIDAVSCPSVSLCVAADNTGDVFTSTNPTGGPGAWTRTSVDSGDPFSALSCPSVSLCVATDNNTAGYGIGNILVSHSPTGGASAWRKAAIDPAPRYHPRALGALSCPSASLCVAVDSVGNAFTSTAPEGSARAWSEAAIDQGNLYSDSLEAVSCPSLKLCVAADESGNVVTSTAPASRTRAWTRARVDVAGCAPPATPCVSEQLFAHDDHGGRMVDSAPAGSGTQIGNVTLGGDSGILNWSHDGAPRTLALR